MISCKKYYGNLNGLMFKSTDLEERVKFADQIKNWSYQLSKRSLSAKTSKHIFILFHYLNQREVINPKALHILILTEIFNIRSSFTEELHRN